MITVSRGLGLNVQEGKRYARKRVNWNNVIYQGQCAVNGLN